MRVLACGVVASFLLWSALTWCAVCASSAEDSSTLSAMTLDLSASLTFIGLARHRRRSLGRGPLPGRRRGGSIIFGLCRRVMVGLECVRSPDELRPESARARPLNFRRS